jgi:hypothetical protein
LFTAINIISTKKMIESKWTTVFITIYNENKMKSKYNIDLEKIKIYQ